MSNIDGGLSLPRSGLHTTRSIKRVASSSVKGLLAIFLFLIIIKENDNAPIELKVNRKIYG